MTHESLHLLCAVEHRVVHVDVDDAGSVLDLLCCNLQCLVIVALSNQSCELS